MKKMDGFSARRTTGPNLGSCAMAAMTRSPPASSCLEWVCLSANNPGLRAS
ncbi:hypothetical protein FQN60_005094 [Etheostoma spectabile]|uniref:Uncharacterized protein n=1 Tax=Etheostoma spectabile TaxID=54343 RepID=A0A5J5DLZ0_9PERO|nr:hypothetical protein FQN60_005094 [Etheostoma spectabile]